MLEIFFFSVKSIAEKNSVQLSVLIKDFWVSGFQILCLEGNTSKKANLQNAHGNRKRKYSNLIFG